jgi:hypothetical protein
VGPLPAAIYWRRRAAVGAALVLIVIAFVAMCGGPDPSGQQGQSGPSPNPPQVNPSAPTSAGAGSAGGGGSPGGSAGAGSPGAGPPGGGSPGAGSPGAGSPGSKGNTESGGDSVNGTGGGSLPVDAPPCADGDMSLTTDVVPSPGVYGGTVSLTLIVRNTSDHACTRDVGSAAQELRVVRATTTIWSSDNCQTSPTTDVRTFGPNIESRFSLQWYTRRIAPNECEIAASPAPVGTYQVVARLGTKLSTPMSFDIAK